VSQGIRDKVEGKRGKMAVMGMFYFQSVWYCGADNCGVSAERAIRDKLQILATENVDRDVFLMELDYQPPDSARKRSI
jgi:hypothetical protein